MRAYCRCFLRVLQCRLRYNRGFDNRLKTSTLTITKLAWRDTVPDTDSYQEIFAQPHLIDENDPLFSDTQPRLQLRWSSCCIREHPPLYAGEGPGRV